MRAVVLAAALAMAASSALAAPSCLPTPAEEELVGKTMMSVKEPDFASLPPLAGCGIWSLEISADGRVGAVKVVRLNGDEALRRAVESWIKALRFEPASAAWTGLIPVTLENGKSE
ncbi:energy transducer TonB [Caulobacter sp. RL271]|jgi:hypothetical protein|uniref:Energy transducer TonB n=1 Tax=Caulobacter segnis TaxID=88688 RepID=A0ABY4ZYA3_9CAUL|nr:energy transducer TonB [Caulobacter segnis]USQ97528.1 energy transducer TonB [Caulobacter segnis]